METRELLVGMEENSVSPTRGHWFSLQANQWFFYNKETEKYWISGQTCHGLEGRLVLDFTHDVLPLAVRGDVFAELVAQQGSERGLQTLQLLGLVSKTVLLFQLSLKKNEILRSEKSTPSQRDSYRCMRILTLLYRSKQKIPSLTPCECLLCSFDLLA